MVGGSSRKMVLHGLLNVKTTLERNDKNQKEGSFPRNSIDLGFSLA